MVSASQAFVEAVRRGHPQRCLLEFADKKTIFTNVDIDMDEGIEWIEAFNTSRNLTIGEAPSSSIRFSIFNDEKRLENFKFGEMQASLGARVTIEGYVNDGLCFVENGTTTIRGCETSPYIRIGNAGTNTYPNWPVASMLLDEKTLYAIKSDGTLWAATVNGTTLTSITPPTLNSHMKNKLKSWAAEHRGLTKTASKTNPAIWYVTEITNEVRTVWEYVRIGTFNVKRPSTVRGREIAIQANDLMCKFDVSFKNKVTDVTYPITAKNLLRKICTAIGVPLNESSLSVMVNDLPLNSKPSTYDNLNCRDIIKQIAEQGGCYARMNRSGQLEMAWFNTTKLSFDEEDYEEYNPSWYDSADVDVVHNRPGGNKDETSGSGNNAYLISNNPFLK